MRNLLLSGCFVLLVMSGSAFARQQCACPTSVQMESGVPTQTALAAIRAAQAGLNAQLGQENTLAFYYNHYYDGILTVESLGVIDGKDWYRVSDGGGSVILVVDDEI